MNLKPSPRYAAVILALGAATLLWTFHREPTLAGVWQTADADNLDMRPTIVLGRAGEFKFDVTGQAGAQRDAAVARWELKDRAIWIIDAGKREKLADVAEVTATSLILSIADAGVQKFNRIADAE
jgi:hypothetical protein